MNRSDQPERLASLIDHLLLRDFPLGVHLANEPGVPDDGGLYGIFDAPRFSLCLSGSASYHVMRGGVLTKLTLTRGEAIAVAPNCVMEPHTDGRYLALGIVFTREMTRFLFAKKIPGKHKGSHRFLLAHHSGTIIDDDTTRFFSAMCRPSARAPGDPYLRGLLKLILLRAREMSGNGTSGTATNKAWFTWRAACQFIGENFSQPIGRTQVADFLQLHPNHLSRLFTQFSGGTFNRHLLRLRLDHAARLLENPSLNISEIARACGFAEANYFIRCFTKHHGISPTKFRTERNLPKIISS